MAIMMSVAALLTVLVLTPFLTSAQIVNTGKKCVCVCVCVYVCVCVHYVRICVHVYTFM